MTRVKPNKRERSEGENMVDLSTQYLGFELKNPVIISSSTLVQNLEGVKDAQQGGAGAVVLRSLFEELIREEAGKSRSELWSGHPEEFDYIMSELEMRYGPRYYLEFVEQAKNIVDIPIIASINCHTPKWWLSYARQIEAAGADAIELNLSLMPTDPAKTSLEIEEQFLSIIKSARDALSVPLAVKIGPYVTSMSHFAHEVCATGVNALVLFNRFYQFDMDIKNMKIVGANWYSSPQEMSLPLRWIAILYNHVNCDLAATTGIHDAEGIIKQILAGAQAVEITSAIYLKGFSYIGTLLNGLESWMKRNECRYLTDFRGQLSLSTQKNPEMYERLQYIKALSGIEKI